MRNAILQTILIISLTHVSHGEGLLKMESQMTDADRSLITKIMQSICDFEKASKMELEKANKLEGKFSPIQHLQNELHLAVSDYGFTSKEAEKEFYDQLNKARAAFKAGAWQHLKKMSLSQSDVQTFLKKFNLIEKMNASGSNVLADIHKLKISCEMSQDVKFKLLSTLQE